MICPKCGTNQAAGSMSCEICGAYLGAGTSPAGGVSALPSVAPPLAPVAAPQVGLVVPAPPVPAWPANVQVGMVLRPNNGLATAGFVCGILGIIPFVGVILCILAITFSSIGLARVNERQGIGRGFAIAGLVMGIAFLFPSACGI